MGTSDKGPLTPLSFIKLGRVFLPTLLSFFLPFYFLLLLLALKLEGNCAQTDVYSYSYQLATCKYYLF